MYFKIETGEILDSCKGSSLHIDDDNLWFWDGAHEASVHIGKDNNKIADIIKEFQQSNFKSLHFSIVGNIKVDFEPADYDDDNENNPKNFTMNFSLGGLFICSFISVEFIPNLIEFFKNHAH